ncbi:SUF system NifU family Fe-S cluster assembly protein [Thermosipho ferrireducens]|uniref:SUF system NifU family Fe-S cluster assembly protein n=1 Tax=Thermosipho ferrireducens TaxID=2571116 RepID=A0ABX7S7E0_9BACT|nr:SUF system NifU family Fe-S cluster assembly protein [Thermosipho ferrireducens]QTA37186.1 SUF system NifU family Fe-S cluster assembly protein [Thermosipho ferrireducens]
MYSELVMDYAKLTKYKGKLNNATFIQEGKNLSCGDEITLYVKIESDKVKEIKFEGIGCAISQASANLMIETVSGKNLSEVKEIIKNAVAMARGEEFSEEVLETVAQLADIKNYPMRIKCFLLAWKTLEMALNEK